MTAIIIIHFCYPSLHPRISLIGWRCSSRIRTSHQFLTPCTILYIFLEPPVAPFFCSFFMALQIATRPKSCIKVMIHIKIIHFIHCRVFHMMTAIQQQILCTTDLGLQERQHDCHHPNLPHPRRFWSHRLCHCLGWLAQRCRQVGGKVNTCLFSCQNS